MEARSAESTDSYELHTPGVAARVFMCASAMPRKAAKVAMAAASPPAEASAHSSYTPCKELPQEVEQYLGRRGASGWGGAMG